MTLRQLGPGLTQTGELVKCTAPWNRVPSWPGQLINPADTRTGTTSARSAGQPHGASPPSSETAVTAGRLPGPSDPPSLGLYSPGTKSACRAVRTPAPQTQGPGHLELPVDRTAPRTRGPELARTAGRPRTSLDQGKSRPGQLVDPTDPQTRGPSQPGQLVDPANSRPLGPRIELAGTNIRPRDLLDMGSESAATAGRLCGISDRDPS